MNNIVGCECLFRSLYLNLKKAESNEFSNHLNSYASINQTKMIINMEMNESGCCWKKDEREKHNLHWKSSITCKLHLMPLKEHFMIFVRSVFRIAPRVVVCLVVFRAWISVTLCPSVSIEMCSVAHLSDSIIPYRSYIITSWPFDSNRMQRDKSVNAFNMQFILFW